MAQMMKVVNAKACGTSSGQKNGKGKGKGTTQDKGKGKGKGKGSPWNASYKAYSKDGIQVLVMNPAKAYFPAQQAALDAEITRIAKADVARAAGKPTGVGGSKVAPVATVTVGDAAMEEAVDSEDAIHARILLTM